VSVEDRMTSVVRVEYDANTDGSFPDAEGAVADMWTLLPGFAAQPCLICDDESQEAPGREWSEDLTTTTILFPIASGLPNNKALRFLFVEASGDSSYYYANGKITNIPKSNPIYSRVRARQAAIG
jgi:hypothetical protein